MYDTYGVSCSDETGGLFCYSSVLVVTVDRVLTEWGKRRVQTM